MRKLLLVCLAPAVLALPVFAGPVEDCNQTADADRQIRGCSEYIRIYAANKPNIAVAHNRRGSAYLRKRLLDPALADFTRAIQLNPRLPEAYLNRGVVLYRKSEYEKALADFTAALPLTQRANRGQLHFNRAATLFRLKREDQAFADLVALAKEFPNHLRNVTFSDVTTTFRALNARKREADALALLQAFDAAKFRGSDTLELYDGLKPMLIEQLARMNRLDDAIPLLADLHQYHSLLTVKVDRRYAPLWSKPAAAPLLQIQDFPGRQLAAAQRAAAKYPKSFQAVSNLVQALRLNGRHAEAIDLGKTALTNSFAYDPSREHEAWLRNAVADVLVADNRFDEAAALLQPLLVGDPKTDPFLVNQFINLGGMLLWQGRFQEAIDTAKKAQGFSSPYGEKWIQSISACALSRLDRAGEAEGILQEMQEKPDENYGAVLRTLLCLGRENDGAALLVKMLQSDQSRSQTLLDLQDCRENPNLSQFKRDLEALLRKIRDRPEVRDAVAPLGVIVTEPVGCGDRYRGV